jgi:Starch-binding associating with outer membrane
MKKISNLILLLGGISLASMNISCKKYLDINTNPNAATSSTPNLVLPQALVYTAANVSSYNNYGSEVCGYAANAGGYGGFGSAWTYNYAPTDFSGLWSSTYDVLNDFQYIINSTQGSDNYAYYNAVAKIMKAYNFQLLVDTYNNVPYTSALKGSASITPTYDDAKTIYPSLATLLDSAIAIIKAAQYPSPLGTSDVMFAGNMTQWIKFANTIKLRLIVRANGVSGVTFANTTFDSNGFLTTDAVVNPGYQKATATSGTQQNPAWNTWVQTYSGGTGNRAWMASNYIFAFYATKLVDSKRGAAIYYGWPSSAIANQLGNGASSVPSAPSTAGAWYSGSTSSLGNAIGVMKGPDMGEPLMLAAESYFLQAEANVRGLISGGNAAATSNFNNGIAASFQYLYKLPNGTQKPGTDYAGDATAYQTLNSSNYLANFSLATTQAQQIEAIITQKYIALNFIHGHEAWNEYRRTHYPAIVNGSSSPTATFASTLSQSTRPDKLPTRILYPSTEYSYNSANVPSNISPFSSLIFWAQ